jgi:hypothetical protein
MKWEIAKYVSECDICWRVKADHLRSTENLQPLNIPEWKWENICIDFIMGLPRTSRGYNSIRVIVDRLTKPAHFIQSQAVCRALHVTHCPLSRHPEDNHLRQKVYLCCSLLGATTWVFGHPPHPKLSLSSPNWRTDRLSQSNHRGYASCLCSDGWSKMGQAPSISWIFIQQ